MKEGVSVDVSSTAGNCEPECVSEASTAYRARVCCGGYFYKRVHYPVHQHNLFIFSAPLQGRTSQVTNHLTSTACSLVACHPFQLFYVVCGRQGKAYSSMELTSVL